MIILAKQVQKLYATFTSLKFRIV